MRNMEKETKYIVLCDPDILINDDNINATIKIAKGCCDKCKMLDFANTAIPCMDMRVYKQHADIVTDSILGGLYPDNYIDKWKLAIIKDSTFKNIIALSLQYNTHQGYIEKYDVDNCTEDNILHIVKHFIQDYTNLKNTEYDIVANNLRTASKYIYDVLMAN